MTPDVELQRLVDTWRGVAPHMGTGPAVAAFLMCADDLAAVIGYTPAAVIGYTPATAVPAEGAR